MIKQSYQLLKLALPYNKREIRKNLFLAIALELTAVVLLYVLNQVYGNLYQGIQAYDTKVIWSSIGKFTGIAMLLVLVNGYMNYFINRLAFAVRAGLTAWFFDVRDRFIGYPNLEQRVQEDFKRFGEASCDFWFGVLKSALHIPVFLGVIISLTQWYIGLAVLIAVALGTILSRIVAKSLVKAQSDQESNEAEFRKRLFIINFSLIARQFEVVNRLFKRLAFTQAGLGQLFVLLPFIILMPLYLSKQIAMGAFFQAVNALGKVIDSLSILIDSRQVIVNIETCLYRLQFLTKEE